nr:M17 family metallopeptidase [Mesorhizobium sp. LNHC229A00]
MKADMGGAAAVVGLLIALARQGSPVHVRGVLGIAKNVGNLVAEPLRADRQPACRSPGETRIACISARSSRRARRKRCFQPPPTLTARP